MSVASDTAGSGGTAAPSPQQTKEARKDAGLTPLRRLLTIREGSIIIVTAIALVYFAASSSRFFNGGNIKTALLPAFAPFAILAAGEVFVMINGEIDLSIGGTYLIAPFIFEKLHSAGIPLILALIITLVCMLVVGVINGFAVSVIGISSFVATLGTLFALEGLTLVISKSTSVTPAGTTILGGSTFEKIFGGGTYSEIIWAVAIVILLQIALSLTRWGIYTVAVGSNRLGASEAGISYKRNMIRNFAVCALLAGLVGILETTRTASASPDISGPNEILFQGISAAVIGGTLLTGGSGTVVGALIGALFLGILHDGLILTGVNANYEFLYLGIAILIAMVINTYVGRIRRGTGSG